MYKGTLKSDGDYLGLLPPFIIRFIYYIYNYRLLYYLPMEMLKRTAVRKDWTISMSESDFRKLVEKCQWEIDKLEEENKKLNETIKDHQLYEEKLEHRIIEFEELLHWE